MQLRLALGKLQETQALDEVLLWGKIRGERRQKMVGIIKDYYIALGINYRGHQEFPCKRFFWAAGNFLFVPLPAARPEVEDDAKHCVGYFTGEHEKVLKAVPKPGKDFTELERLAYVVGRIEHDTHVIPQGAFKFTPIQEYKKNEQFKGTARTHRPRSRPGSAQQAGVVPALPTGRDHREEGAVGSQRGHPPDRRARLARQ
jgi:radial spoke head protein 9